jgi:hypothetical protein
MCHTLRATDSGVPDHLREQLDPSRAMQTRRDMRARLKGASLNTYGMQYAYLIFDFFSKLLDTGRAWK